MRTEAKNQPEPFPARPGGTILCVGALTMDTIFRLDELPTGPGKFIPTEAVEVAEGMAAAQAATIARLGGKSMLWASRGDDAIGDRLVAQIAGEGVDCSVVRTVPGARSGFSTIFMDRAGERIIVPKYDADLMSPPDGLPDVDFRALAAVMVDVRWPGAAELALREARRVGIPGILDADVAPKDVLKRLFPLASHVVASLPAATLLSGYADPTDALSPLIDLNKKAFVAITAGERGSIYSEPGVRVHRHMPAPTVVAIDTLAAGDVFHGAFALGLTEGWRMTEIIRFASSAAAIKCTRFGGRLGCPTRDEIAALGY